MTHQANFYAILGVTQDAEAVVITAVYRALVKKYHPDVYPHADGASRIRDINAAYEILGNSEKRAFYDTVHDDDDGASSSQRERFNIVDVIGLKANIAVTNTIDLHIPPAVFLDRFLITLLNSPQRHAAAFKDHWNRLPSLRDAGSGGYQLMAAFFRGSVEEATSHCTELLIDARLDLLGGEVLARLCEATEVPLRSALYDSITLDGREQRRVFKFLGDEMGALLIKADEILVDSVLNQMSIDGAPTDSLQVIEQRRQRAKGAMAKGAAGSLDQAVRALQLSLHDNSSALAVVFEQLLDAGGWEDRLSGFVDLVRAAGPIHFFEAGSDQPLGIGDVCLATKIGQLFAALDVEAISRGLECIRQALLPDWDVRGEVLLDHCVTTVTNDILDANRPLSWALPRLENMALAEPSFFPGRLQGVLERQVDKAVAWARIQAERAATGGQSDVDAAGRAARLVSPGGHAQLLAEAAWASFVCRLNGNDVMRPEASIKSIANSWYIDAAQLWRDASIHYMACRLTTRSIANAGEWRTFAAQVTSGAHDPTLADAVHRRTVDYLVTGDWETPSAIFAHAMSVLGTDDRWISGPVPADSLQTLRALMLRDLGNLPGELVSPAAPAVVKIVRQLRSDGRYFSLGGTVALVAGRKPENCYALTANGIYRAGGGFHSYAEIIRAEPVEGWTQVYLRYLVGAEMFELNDLGSLSVATFLSTVIRNGMRLTQEFTDDETRSLFAGLNIASEIYLDRWVGSGQLVFVTDQHKLLPAVLAGERLLAGLMAVPQTQPVKLSGPDGEGVAAAAAATRPGDSLPVVGYPNSVERLDPTSLILDLCAQFAGKGFGIGTAIDARKLLNARQAFPIPLDVKVIGLLDTTLLSTNEKGLAVTSNGLYWRNGWTQETNATHLSWKEFDGIVIEQHFSKFGLGPGNYFDTAGAPYPNATLNNLLNTVQANLRLTGFAKDMPPSGDEAAGVPDQAGIAQIIEWTCNNHSGGAIPLRGQISAKKLAAAQKGFPLIANSEVIGLIDTTVFGSNKTGIAICADGIVWKNDWTTKTQKQSLSWSELAEREIGGAAREVLFGPDAVIGIGAATLKPATLVAILNAICDAVRACEHGV